MKPASNKLNNDWKYKMILQKDNDFIEHVLFETQEYQCIEDALIDKIDNGMISSDIEEQEDYEEFLYLKRIDQANDICNQLEYKSRPILEAKLATNTYQEMSERLGVSVSTAWKQWKRVQKEIDILVQKNKMIL